MNHAGPSWPRTRSSRSSRATPCGADPGVRRTSMRVVSRSSLSAFGPRRGRGVSESRRRRLRELAPPRRHRRDAVAAALDDAPARRYVVKNIPMEMVVAGADSASELELWEDGSESVYTRRHLPQHPRERLRHRHVHHDDGREQRGPYRGVLTCGGAFPASDGLVAVARRRGSFLC